MNRCGQPFSLFSGNGAFFYLVARLHNRNGRHPDMLAHEQRHPVGDPAGFVEIRQPIIGSDADSLLKAFGRQQTEIPVGIDLAGGSMKPYAVACQNIPGFLENFPGAEALAAGRELTYAAPAA